MAKTDTPRRRKRQRKAVEEDNSVVSEEQRTEEDSATNSTEMEMKRVEEDQDEQDPQMNTMIEVKGNTRTVTLSWEKKNEEGEGDDTEKTADAVDQMTAREMTDCDEQMQIISPPDAASSTQGALSQTAERKMEKEMQKCGHKQVNGKQKAAPRVVNPPSKKAKVNSDGFCLFVGNLNSSKTYEEVNESLEKYFMSQGILFQDIRMDRSRKHAFVDLVSEMDLTKALVLNGEILLDKPMKITKAKIKSEDKVKMKAPVMDSKVNGKRKADPVIENSPSKKTKVINDGFCLFVGNLNSSKTFEEVKESLVQYFMSQSLLFQDIRLDRSRKHAFVDLLSEMDLTKSLTLNGEILLDKPMKIAKAKIRSEDKVQVKSPEQKKQAKDARCLFVKNLPYNATKQDILKIFHKAIAVRFPGGTEGPSQGIAFVEFKNTAIAKKVRKQKQGAKIQNRVLIVDRVGETNVPRVTKAKVESNSKKDKKALQSSQNIKAAKKEATAQRSEKSEKANVPTKTLIVMGLTEKTSAETLESAFEGAISTRLTVNKREVSKRFGFVDFDSVDNCKAAKEAMEDCEIDGCKVTIAYANPKNKRRRRAQGKGRGGGTSQDAEVKQN